MHSFNNIPSSNAQISSRTARPRLSRALPSLLVLTTALAWGASVHAAGLGLDGSLPGAAVTAGPALVGGAGVGVGLGLGANTAVQPGSGTANAGVGLDAGVRAGVNGNVTAEQRMAATGAAASAGAGAQVDSGVNASGALNSTNNVTTGAGQLLDGVKGTGQAAGDTAVQGGKRVTKVAKAKVTSGAKSANQAVGAGVQAAGSATPGIKANVKAGAAVQGEVPVR